MNKLIGKGLKKLEKDKRDFKLGAAFKLPSLSTLPTQFELPVLGIKDQGETDFCTGFSSTLVSELQENVVLSPEYAFQAGKKLYGDVEGYGQDLRKAMLAHVKIGTVEQKDAPFSVIDKDAEFLRNPKNWPDSLESKALVHSKGSVLAVTGPYDAFDNIRAAIWLFRAEVRGVVFGVDWGWPSDVADIDTAPDTNGDDGHAIPSIGWVIRGGVVKLKIPNSWGTSAGDKGYFYMCREAVNKWVDQYGSFMFVDITPAEYQDRVKKNAQLSILDILKKLLIIIGIIKSQQPVPVPPAPTPAPVPEPPAPNPSPAPVPHISKIPIWAKGISIQEGDFVGSRSRMNGNPGNIKYSDYTKTLGAIGKDKDNFCQFPNWEVGMKALEQFLTDAANNKLIPYKNCTLSQFTKIYAQPPNNNYENGVAKYLGVSPTILIKQLL